MAGTETWEQGVVINNDTFYPIGRDRSVSDTTDVIFGLVALWGICEGQPDLVAFRWLPVSWQTVLRVSPSFPLAFMRR